jgi:uncharacterized protein YqjF (DUF2071 family)
MSFLKAEWRKLVMANYEIDPDILSSYIPYGTELDLYQGKCFISLVGFMFLNTKLLGLTIPFHTTFEEINLRFYVKRKEQGEWKRGVVFIKEIVPKVALTLIANSVYRENYETLKMDHSWSEYENEKVIEYRFLKNKTWQSIKVYTELIAKEIEPNSETEFITEHYWGYARVNDKQTNEYEVIHPKWQHYPVTKYEVDVDYETVYGSIFAFLNTIKPNSVLLAEGSEISVEGKRSLYKK